MTDLKKPEEIADDALDAARGGAADYGEDGILRTQSRTDIAADAGGKTAITLPDAQEVRRGRRGPSK